MAGVYAAKAGTPFQLSCYPAALFFILLSPGLKPEVIQRSPLQDLIICPILVFPSYIRENFTIQ